MNRCVDCLATIKSTSLRCRACYIQWSGRPREVPVSKTCTVCGVEKPIRDFAKDCYRRTGYSARCKACHVAKNSQWQRDNPEKVRERNRRWERRHPEAMRRKWYRRYLQRRARGETSTERVRAWRERNREHVRRYAMSRYRANPLRHREWSDKWRARNPDRVLMINRAHRAVKLALKSGRLIKGTACEFCGAVDVVIEAAHTDYSKRLEVKWLCRPCHRLWDHNIPKSDPVAVRTIRAERG